MRHQTAITPSSLPSLMMPCPVCSERMTFETRSVVSADVEDTVYACRGCGTELIRSSVREVRVTDVSVPEVSVAEVSVAEVSVAEVVAA